jgi:hypothetical protein
MVARGPHLLLILTVRLRMVYRVLAGILAVLGIGFGIAAFFWYSGAGIYQGIVAPLAIVGIGTHFLGYAITGRGLFKRKKGDPGTDDQDK